VRLAALSILLSMAAAPAQACDVGPFELFFASGSTSISAEGRRILNAQADMFRELSPKAGSVLRVRVIAHTDTAGDAPLNESLSQQRARQVSAYLIGRGVPPSRIDAVANGERRPLVAGRDGKHERRNRVAIVHIVKSTCGG
jgi:OOP family OmpA-OmpF porin